MEASLLGVGKEILHKDDPEITGIISDSRQVVEGSLFVALVGQQWDGHDFVGSAILGGAAAVVVQEGASYVPLPEGARVFVVTDTRAALAHLAAAFHSPLPSSYGRRFYGITGTNGKTTTSYIVEAILRAAGHQPALIGTVSYRVGEQRFPAPLTTPDALLLWRLVERMSEAGADALVMEVSSHALAQYRADGIPFQTVGWSNLTQDHLDYHGDMASYGAAKARLWRDVVSTDGRAILNADDPSFGEMAAGARCAIWSYSVEAGREASIRLREAKLHLHGVSAILDTPAGEVKIESPLMGRFNLSNLALAVGMTLAQEIPIAVIEEGIAGMSAVPGRLEAVESGLPYQILVDYAHTPDALEQVLRSLRPICPGRLMTVFGCGGDRDRAKRPLMGKIAAELSDLYIVTSDNPRTEDPQAIVEDILKGMGGVSEAPLVCLDRRHAIEKAVMMAQDGDILLIAGKGHEDYQIVGTTRYPFDDREVARYALQKKRGSGKDGM